jgi:DNA primase large subunit
MSLEQKPEQFNKEVLRGKLSIALENYANNIDKINRVDMADAEDNVLAKQEEKLLQEVIKKWKVDFINEMVSALKIGWNTKEILDLFSEVFEDINAKRSELYDKDGITSEYAELDFLKTIIIKLLS